MNRESASSDSASSNSDSGVRAAMGAPPEVSAFTQSLAELEARIANADAGGAEVPPEARAMLTRLRELVQALNDLTSTLSESRSADGDSAG